MIMCMKKSIILSGLIIGVMLMPSCASQLDITPPNAITNEQIEDLLKNGTDAQRELVMTSMVAPMVGYLNNLDRGNVGSGGAADVLNYSDQGNEWRRSIQGNDVAMGWDRTSYDLAGRDYYWLAVDFTGPQSATNKSYWFSKAYAINQANLVLNTFTQDAAKEGSAMVKDGRARALIVRAFSYMRLMEDYQDAYLRGGKDKLGMSIYTKYDPAQTPAARSTSEETYKFIKDDLNEAVSLLTAANVGYTGGRDKAEDIDLGVANFLLARVSLWTGDWTTCINACNAIIGSKAYSFIAPGNWGGRNTGAWTPTSAIKVLPETNAFAALAVNPECILGFKMGSTNAGAGAIQTALANIFGTYSSLNSPARIDDRLYNKIAENDCRKDAFYAPEIGDYGFAAATSRLPSYCNLKFAQTAGLNNDGVSNDGDNAHTANAEFTRFRLAEVYLMKAEAENAGGNANAAKTTLNALLKARTKDGAATLTCDNYGGPSNFTEFIQLQWRIEMWGENGMEYYNNKRWGIDVNRSGSTVHPATSATLSASKMTLELPQRELEDNPNTTPNGI